MHKQLSKTSADLNPHWLHDASVIRGLASKWLRREWATRLHNKSLAVVGCGAGIEDHFKAGSLLV